MIKIYVCGTTSPNPGKGVYSFIMYNDKETRNERGIFSQYTTPGIAEYEAIARALNRAKELGFKSVEIISSNKLIVRQLNQESNPHQLKEYYNRILKLSKTFEDLNFSYIDHKENKAVDFAQSLLKPKRSRIQKARELAQNAFVKVNDNEYIYIKEDSYYHVNPKKLTCTCYDNAVNGYVCKHILAARMIEERMQKLLD